MTGEGRLVRDCMIEKVNRVRPVTRPVRDRGELVDTLHQKLLEEVGEILKARTGPELLEELGDLSQCILDLAAANNYTPGDVEMARAAKHADKGGFGTILMWEQPEE